MKAHRAHDLPQTNEGQTDVPPIDDLSSLESLPDDLPTESGQPADAFDGLDATVDDGGAIDASLFDTADDSQLTDVTDAARGEPAADFLAPDASQEPGPVLHVGPVTADWLKPGELTRGDEPNADKTSGLPMDAIREWPGEPRAVSSELPHRHDTPARYSLLPHAPDPDASMNIALLSSAGDSSGAAVDAPNGPDSPPPPSFGESDSGTPSMSRPVLLVSLADSKDIIKQAADDLTERLKNVAGQVAQSEVNAAFYAPTSRSLPVCAANRDPAVRLKQRSVR